MTEKVLRIVAGMAAVGFGVFVYIYVTLPDVRPLATTNPTATAFMELREREAAAEGRTLRRDWKWVPYSRISQNLKRAVLVAEDDGFWSHEGIELEQMKEAVRADIARGRPARGGSTITQQLAKNLYLTPSKDPLRKLRELIIARRLEAGLEKARIFEIYLNVIEWGDGVWGVEAAARRYFGVPAAALSPEQAAALAGAIVNPRHMNPSRPAGRLARRQQIIMARMGMMTPPAPTPVIAPAPIPPETPAELEPEAPPTTEIPEEAPAEIPIPSSAPPPVEPTQ